MQAPSPAQVRRAAALFKAILFGAGLGAAVASCGGGGGGGSNGAASAGSAPVGVTDPYNPPGTGTTAPPTSSTPTTSAVFAATSVVADSGTAAAHVDSNLVNGWGIAFNPNGYVWVANQGTSTSTLYDGNGVQQSLVVAVPPGNGGSAGPTGIVFNGTQDFKVTANGASGVAAFIFVGTGGTVSGWSPAVDGTHAITMVDTGANGATASSYTGLALAASAGAGANHLYAADFRNGHVDVYDTNWKKVALAGSFADPDLPAGYAPFGIQAVGDRIYVTYAQRAANGRETFGAGLGIVDAFDTAGTLVKRLVSGGALNAPWGIALAPANFGAFSNMLLVGNFGDGTINAYDPASGTFAGTLSRADKTPIAIDGLWGIAFGNGINAQPANTLFYAAGPAGGTHGAYGRIDLQ